MPLVYFVCIVRWVLGITAVLDMVKREASMRAAKARVIDSAPEMARVKSVFVTKSVTSEAKFPRSNTMPTRQHESMGPGCMAAFDAIPARHEKVRWCTKHKHLIFRLSRNAVSAL